MRQADDTDAMRLRPLDAERHRLGADHLAEPESWSSASSGPLVGNADVVLGAQAASSTAPM